MSLGVAWSRYKQLAMSDPELSIPDAMFIQHFVHSLIMESVEYLDMTFGGVFVHCTVEEGKLILEKILWVTPLADLHPIHPTISEDESIITNPDASDIPTLPTKVELLQLTAPKHGSNEDIEDHTPFPLSIEEDIFIDDIGNLSNAPACNIKGLNVEPPEQDLEGFIDSQENLLHLSTIISRAWTEDVEEDNNYIKVFPNSKIICCCLHGFKSQKACYDPRVGVNILLMDKASGVDLHPLIPSMKILRW
jgi:hypothetical protein